MLSSVSATIMSELLTKERGGDLEDGAEWDGRDKGGIREAAYCRSGFCVRWNSSCDSPSTDSTPWTWKAACSAKWSVSAVLHSRCWKATASVQRHHYLCPSARISGPSSQQQQRRRCQVKYTGAEPVAVFAVFCGEWRCCAGDLQAGNFAEAIGDSVMSISVGQSANQNWLSEFSEMATESVRCNLTHTQTNDIYSP
jgi:hypothetical protein